MPTDEDDALLQSRIKDAAFEWANKTYPQEYAQIAAAGFIQGANECAERAASLMSDLQDEAATLRNTVRKLSALVLGAGTVIDPREGDGPMDPETHAKLLHSLRLVRDSWEAAHKEHKASG